MRGQRDQALACAWLALAIAVATLWSNFSLSYDDVRAARAAADQHRALIADHERILAANDAALKETRTALERLRTARTSSTP